MFLECLNMLFEKKEPCKSQNDIARGWMFSRDFKGMWFWSTPKKAFNAMKLPQFAFKVLLGVCQMVNCYIEQETLAYLLCIGIYTSYTIIPSMLYKDNFEAIIRRNPWNQSWFYPTSQWHYFLSTQPFPRLNKLPFKALTFRPLTGDPGEMWKFRCRTWRSSDEIEGAPSHRRGLLDHVDHVHLLNYD